MASNKKKSLGTASEVFGGDDMKKDSANSEKYGKAAYLVIFLLIPVLICLFFNERSFVRRQKAHFYVQDEIVELNTADPYDPSYEGKLVHATGLTESVPYFYDSEFGYRVAALKFKKKVSYYQLIEHTHETPSKTQDGKDTTITTYSYDYGWLGYVNQNYYREKRNNNFALYYKARDTVYTPQKILFGSYQISPDFFKDWEMKPFEVHCVQRYLLALNARIGRNNDPGKEYVHDFKSRHYIGLDPDNPALGDVSITYSGIPDDTVSVIARVKDGCLVTDKYEKKVISSIKRGVSSFDEMYKSVGKENTSTLWLFRGLIFLALYASFYYFLQGRKRWFVRTLLGSLGIGGILASIPWMSYNKGLAVLLLVVGICLVISFILLCFGVNPIGWMKKLKRVRTDKDYKDYEDGDENGKNGDDDPYLDECDTGLT